ncbi:hypothetical protein ABZ215_24240 [Amycolatopsis sp. NPDC006131]|uniref:YncE family protein n=1 Tax=Amycolatopsis sp. NPDC006131 TaxID=3156731 RepID=UPI00339DFEF4
MSNSGSDTVTQLQGTHVTATIPVGDQPEGLAAAPDHTFLYVAATGANAMSVVDIPTGVLHATGAQSEGVAVSPP